MQIRLLGFYNNCCFLRQRKKYSQHKQEIVIYIFCCKNKLEIINSAYLLPLSKEINMVLSFKYPNMISLPACHYVVFIFIHILDYAVSHYFNTTLFLHRQYLAPCKAEVAVSGFQYTQSNSISYWSEVTLHTTGHVFVGGLPLTYSSYEVRLLQLLDCIWVFFVCVSMHAVSLDDY